MSPTPLEKWFTAAKAAGLRPAQAQRIVSLVIESIGHEKASKLGSLPLQMIAGAVLEGLVFASLNMFSPENVVKKLRDVPSTANNYEVAESLSRAIAEEVAENLVACRTLGEQAQQIMVRHMEQSNQMSDLINLAELYIAQQGARAGGDSVETISIGEREASPAALSKARKNTVAGWRRLAGSLKASGHWVELWNKYCGRQLTWAETTEFMEAISRYINAIPATDDPTLREIRRSLDTYWLRLDPFIRKEMETASVWTLPV